MKQKIIKVGNSAAVTIPKEFLAQLNTHIGAGVRMHLQSDAGRIIVDVVQKTRPEDVIDKEVYNVAKSLLKQYKVAFKELARR